MPGIQMSLIHSTSTECLLSATPCAEGLDSGPWGVLLVVARMYPTRYNSEVAAWIGGGG